MEHVLYMYDGGAMRLPRGYLPVAREACVRGDLLMY